MEPSLVFDFKEPKYKYSCIAVLINLTANSVEHIVYVSSVHTCLWTNT